MISNVLRFLSSVGLIISPAIFLDTLVKSTLLLVLALLFCVALRRASAASKHYLLGLTMASLCLIPILSAFGPQLRVLPASWTLALGENSPLEIASRPAAGALSAIDQAPASVASSPDMLITASDVPFPTTEPAVNVQTVPPSSTLVEAGSNNVSTRPWLPIAWQSLAALWMVGCMAMLARLMLAMLRLRRTTGRAKAIDGGTCLGLVEQLAKGLRTSRQVRLFESDQAAMPMTWGVWRPSIMLPAECDAWSDERKRVVLRHELAHIQRYDSAWLLLTEVVRAFYWFHPLVWFAARQMTAYREQACDDRVLTAGHTPIEYAEHLLHIATHNANAMLPCTAAIGMARANQLESRIRLILDAARNRSALSRSLAGGLALLLAAIALPLAILHAAEPQTDNVAPLETAKGLTYSGIVVNKKSGEPIEGVEVLVRLKTSSEHPWPTLDESTYPTDAKGNYQFTITPDQLGDSHLYIEVEAAHPDYARKSPSGYALSMIRKNQKLGEEPFFARIELRPAEAVFGILLDPDGQPATGVNVLGYSKENPRDLRDYGSFTSTETDEQGHFRLNMVAGGHSVVWFRPRDFAPETHVLKERKGDLGNIQLERGVSLSGRVVDSDGKPVAGVWVNAELRSGPAKKSIEMPVADSLERSALTDGEGRYLMRPLPAGVYRVLPEERPSDALVADRTPRPLPATFLPHTFDLSDGQRNLDIQASESVVIRARTLSSSGKPTRGHGFHFAGWVKEDGGGFYSRNAEPDPDGNVEIRVPKGLKKAQLNFSTNEHGALRIRLSPGDPLVGKRDFDLGPLDRDYDQIEIIRYKAPILLVEVIDASGERLDDITVSVVYKDASLNKDKGTRYFGASEDSDVGFDHQQDNRWRSSQLLPDERFELRVIAQGKEFPRQQLQLEEGETRTIELAVEGTEARAPTQ